MVLKPYDVLPKYKQKERKGNIETYRHAEAEKLSEIE